MPLWCDIRKMQASKQNLVVPLNSTGMWKCWEPWVVVAHWLEHWRLKPATWVWFPVTFQLLFHIPFFSLRAIHSCKDLAWSLTQERVLSIHVAKTIPSAYLGVGACLGHYHNIVVRVQRSTELITLTVVSVNSNWVDVGRTEFKANR